MPKAPRRCPKPGCTNRIRHRAYCDLHTPPPWSGKTTVSARHTQSSAWRRLRERILERDDHQCQIRGPRCTRAATQVDHILNLARGGTDDPDNLQSACPECNARKAAQESAAVRGAPKPPWRTFD